MTFQAQILTLYPEMFPGPLGVSLAGKALAQGKWACEAINPRDFAQDKHRSVDDTPAGGGVGMVLRADIMGKAVDFAENAINEKIRLSRAKSRDGALEQSASTTLGMSGNGEVGAAPILALTPRGKPISQNRIRELSSGLGITLICGRFEGFDERLFAARPQIEQVSFGDIILSGGEIAAMALLDACIRLLPGVMGAAQSGEDESFETGLLEYPHYTRPQIWEGREIPQVLRSGDHAKVDAWRKQRAEDDTRLRRPDLWERYVDARDQSASGARQEKKKE